DQAFAVDGGFYACVYERQQPVWQQTAFSQSSSSASSPLLYPFVHPTPTHPPSPRAQDQAFTVDDVSPYGRLSSPLLSLPSVPLSSSLFPALRIKHSLWTMASTRGMYERQQPVWQTILSFMLPVFTVACCLFPVFPHWCKLTVLYFLLGLIALIFLLLFVRVAIFGVIWLALGKRVWFFPSILAEEGSLAELFRFWPDKDDKRRR
ncbi:hypothetical protein CLOP_g22052, partial [Closterium sp. NIES-67]